MYKAKLQELCHQKKFALPKYSCMKDGPDHNPKFKASVIVNRINFDTQTMCKSSKEAYNEAAKLAFLHFTSGTKQASDQEEAVQGNDVSLYKNLLQQLAQNEGLFLPTYKTIGSGDPHDRTFISTVEVEGEMFNGKAAKSKKQAELNAAMAAYTALIERKSSETGESFHTSSDGGNVVNASDPQGNANPEYSSASNSAISYESRVKESKGEDDGIDSTENDLNTKNSNASLEPLSFSPKESRSSSAMTTQPDLSTLSISDSSTKNAKEINCYLLCNRVRVYTCIPDISLPDGTVLLQIAENKWVAVSLEFNK